jgi:hypothetical protein
LTTAADQGLALNNLFGWFDLQNTFHATIKTQRCNFRFAHFPASA